MAGLDIDELRAAITAAGADWTPRTITRAQARKGLGWEPSEPQVVASAEDDGRRLLAKKLAGKLNAPVMPLPPRLLKALRKQQGDANGHGVDVRSLRSRVVLNGVPSTALGSPGGFVRPRRFDWRDHGVIGPVTDQRWCGSCVSFATTGLVSAMTAIELNVAPPDLSEADQHFNSSHGASCGGWNNFSALDQARTRGIARDVDFRYLDAFDSPPVTTDPSDPNALWAAHSRAIPERDHKITRITAITAHSGDDRKTYLATVGPLVCGFTVFQDFDSYGGGVYRHVTGNVRGGHAVLVIGYDDDLGAWICRNSWGEGFGGAAHADGTGAGFFMIGYGDSGIDGEAMYGATGVLAPADLNGWGHWRNIRNGVAAPACSIYGTSRRHDQLDVFVSGTDLTTYTAALTAGTTDWAGWWNVRNGKAAPAASTTLVSRSTNKLDAFTVGLDQKIYTAAWQPEFSDGWHGWWNIRGGAAAPGTTVHGVSRSTDKLDVFAVGTDQKIYTAAWQPEFSDGWHGWWNIQGGKAAPRTSVTAVSRSTDKLDVFAVGTDQKIYTAAWQPEFSDGWHGWWNIRGGVAAPGTSVFAVSRSTDKLDVFAVGTDRCVYTAAWEPGFTDGWHGWWRIGNMRVAPGTSVHAVSARPDWLDVFAVAEDGTVRTARWRPGRRWQGWFLVRRGAAAAGTDAIPVSRRPGVIDLQVVGTDRRTYSAEYVTPEPIISNLEGTLQHIKLDH